MENSIFNNDNTFFKSNELTEGGLLKAKRVWVPPSGGKKGYYREDPRDKKVKEKKEDEPKLTGEALLKNVIGRSIQRHFPDSKMDNIKITSRSNGEKTMSVDIDGKTSVMSVLPEKLRRNIYQMLNTN